MGSDLIGKSGIGKTLIREAFAKLKKKPYFIKEFLDPYLSQMYVILDMSGEWRVHYKNI